MLCSDNCQLNFETFHLYDKALKCIEKRRNIQSCRIFFLLKAVRQTDGRDCLKHILYERTIASEIHVNLFSCRMDIAVFIAATEVQLLVDRRCIDASNFIRSYATRLLIKLLETKHNSAGLDIRQIIRVSINL